MYLGAGGGAVGGFLLFFFTYKLPCHGKLKQLFLKIYHTESCAEPLVPPRPSPINFL